MSTKKEIWRLLEPGESCNGGDEAYHHSLQLWHQIVAPDSLKGLDKPVRRRMTLPEPQGWISVKERMPDHGTILRRQKDGGDGLWRIEVCNWTAPIAKDGHWMQVPDAPEPIDPDEEAWKAYEQKENEDCGWSSDEWELCRKLFLAGRRSVATEGGSHA